MHIALDRAGKEIWATFGPGLDKLTKPIGDLSQGIVASTKVFIGSGGFNLAISAATVGLQKFDDLLNGKSKPGGKPSGKPPTPSDAGKGQVTPDVSGKLPALFTAPLAEKAWAWTKSELPWTAAESMIEKFESGGRNVMHYINDTTHTAGGFFQITNTTWKQFGRSVSGAEKYATAISAPFKIKEAKQRGLGPWAAYDVPLGHAAKDYYAHHLSDTHYNVRPPDSAKTHPASTATTAGGSGSPNVQQPAPVHIVIHGNTGAVSPISANAAAGGVY